MNNGGHNNAAAVPEVHVDMAAQQDPVSIKSNGHFEVPLDTSNLHPGWYWAVFCVSLEDLKNIQDKLDSITFDVTREKMVKGVVYKLDYTCKTAIRKDEIDLLPKTKFARLKLHRQIEVKSGADLTISIKVETGPGCEDVSFDLHYFELACFDTCSGDHVLWGEGKPDQYIRIGDEDAESQKKPLAIGASDVSSSGKLAVTMYFNPAITDPRIFDQGNRCSLHTFTALHTYASDPACAPEGARAFDHAYTNERDSTHNPKLGSTHVPEKVSAYGTDQALTPGLHHSTSLSPPQHCNQSRAPTPTPSHAHSHTSDGVNILEQVHSHAPSSASTLGVAHIDVWDVSPPSDQGSSDIPRAITKPLTTLVVPLPALKRISGERTSSGDPPEPPKPTINISSTGLHIIMAVGWATTAAHATPFLIYRRESDGNEEQGSPVTYSYKPVPRICRSLQNYFGYGAFHKTDPDDPNPENERYFNFHGLTFDVYSTSGSWKQLYSLTFGIKGNLSRPEDMIYLTQSLRGRYFAWTGDRGVVSIWDFETGKFVKTILIPKDKRGVCAALSEDNSMIAITVNGCIQLHDVASGIKLGVHKAEWKEDNGSEIIFRQDYFMALNAAESTSGSKNIDARSIFRARDMTIVKTHIVFWQYAAEYASTLNPVFLYQQGALLNIKRLGNILCPTEDNDCTPDTQCQLKNTPLNLKGKKWLYHDQPRTKPKFVVGPAHSTSRILSITRLTITIGPITTFLSLGPRNMKYFGFFMPASSQLVLILNGILQVWRLPSAAGQQFELVHVEAIVADSEKHANDICIIKPSKEVKDDEENDEAEDYPEKEMVKGESRMKDAKGNFDEEDDLDSDQPQTFIFPRAAVRCQYEKGVASLLDTYADSDLSIKHAIIRFLVDRIRPSPKYSSSLVILCRSWKFGYREIFEEVITNLLPSDKITWIPDINATKNENPLWILTKIAKKSPSVLGVCKVIMDYCVHHAVDSKNLSFLSPFLRSLKRIMNLFPDEARVYLRRIAYIPVSDRWRDYIVENSIVTQPPWSGIRLRKTPLRLDKIKKPIMQLHVTAEGPRNTAEVPRSTAEGLLNTAERPCTKLRRRCTKSEKPCIKTERPSTKADTFNRPIYVASFDALWHFKDDCKRERNNSGEPAIKVSMVQQCSPNLQISIIKCWLKIMVGLKIKQEPKTAQGSTIKQGSMKEQEAMQESMLELAPAQTVTAPTGLDGQIHPVATRPKETTWWKTVYHMFRLKCHLKTHTYVECHDFSLEFLDNPAIAALVSYKWNTIGYAYFAFRFFFQCVFYTLVFVAALLQVYHENVKRVQLGGVFVAIIVVGAVFLWLELLQALKNFKRYRRDLYNLLDIVAYSLPMVASVIMLVILCDNDIAANTRILSYSVLAVFMHMLFELRIYKSVCKYITIIRQSVIEIRGGRFDPIEEQLESDDWGFHFMMMINFFFTVIVMLNVLIALINKAFTKGDDDWRLDWIESRLHYIELAENLSYHIPGFRQTHNWFPKEIYFSVPAKEVAEYREEELKTQVQSLKKQLSDQQEMVEKQFQELKDLLRARPDINRAETETSY
ncbi:hypothetical protein EC968_006837 [Mortierella alpina]|nr:hypothetical protein EC968_006837 [Mortierella alpina]